MEPRANMASARSSWFTMRLRTLLFLLAALSVWFGIVSNSARQTRKAMTEIEKRDGYAMFADQWSFSSGGDLPARKNSPAPPLVRYIRSLIGPEYFSSIAGLTVMT